MTITEQAAQDGVYYSQPTRLQRFGRWLGFRYHLGEEPPDVENLLGWMRTDTGFNFDWRDRLRILISGRFRMSTITHFDTPSPMVCKTRVDFHILAPWHRE